MNNTDYNRSNILYFTGTGGTEYVARAVYNEINGRNREVNLIEMNNRFEGIDECDLLFVLYPVYAGDASAAVYQSINKLKKVNSKRCVILSINAGGDAIMNTAARNGIKRKLKVKGYNSIYQDMIVMPNNFMVANSMELNSLLLQAVPLIIKDMVEKVMSGIEYHRNVRLIDRFIRTMAKPFKMFSRLCGKKLYANDNCISCNLCAKKCPRGNIKIISGKPQFSMDCTLCLRCIYQCPTNAIGNRIANTFKIKEGFDIKLINMDIVSILNKDDIVNNTSDDSIRKYLIIANQLIDR